MHTRGSLKLLTENNEEEKDEDPFTIQQSEPLCSEDLNGEFDDCEEEDGEGMDLDEKNL